MKILGVFIAAAAVVCVSSEPWSSYDYYDSYSKPSSSYGSSSSSKYDSYSKPSSSYLYGSSSKYDSYSKPSSSYGSSSSSKYYDDYYSKPRSSYGYGSSSKYDSYSKPSSSYGSSSSSKYYDDYYSKPSSSYGYGSSSKYDSYSKPSSSYGSGSYSKYDYYSKSRNSSESERSRNSNCNCGWVNKGRIVGGQEAKKNAYPFVVALDFNGVQDCGATILTERHIATAAHCTYGRSPRSMQVRVGLHDLNKGQGKVYQIEKLINHERYNDRTLINDIALIVLKTPIKMDQNVGPVCMPSKQVNLEGQKIRALGWGRIWTNGPGSTFLQEVDLDVISYAQCEKAWKGSGPTKGQNLCTYAGRKDTCQGDSGGPLVWLNPSTNRYTIVALVSFGGDCAGPLPAVNTDVAWYRDWINSKIAGSGLSACTKG